MTIGLEAVVILAGIGFAIFAIPARASSDAPEQRFAYLDLSDQEQWTLASEGDYHCRYDRRDLYCMYHTFGPSNTGDHATLTTTVTIPRDWKPPYGLELYCSDDYVVREEDYTTGPRANSLNAWAYPGHRFKQVLVNGEVVWEADVADYGRGKVYGIDLTDHVTPGKAFELSMRVIDRVGMEVKLPGEHYFGGQYGNPEDDPRLFPCHVYWGDLLLTERFSPEALRPPRESPGIRTLRQRAAEGLVPRGPARLAQQPATLVLEAPRGAAPGYPLSCGIPLPRGEVCDAPQLKLTDPDGRRYPAQFRAISRWQDGSVRSALLEMTVPDGAQPGARWTVSWGQRRLAPAPAVVSVSQEAAGTRIANGLVSLRTPGRGDVAFSDVQTADGRKLAGAMRGHVIVETESGPKRYKAAWETCEVLSAGPVRVTVELRGRLLNRRQSIGRCVLRFCVSADSPLIRAWFRIFNDTPADLKVREVALVQQVPRGPARGHVATIAEPDGWLAVDGPESASFAAIRWAAERPTAAIELEGQFLSIRPFASTEATPLCVSHSGEAGRFEVVVGYYTRAGSPRYGTADGDFVRVAASCQRPPRLWCSEWACATGAFGYAATRDSEEFPALEERLRAANADVSRDAMAQNTYDVRHFGDRHYRGDSWCNGYYDANRGFIAEYLMSANPNAFDRAEEEVVHQINVDQCHWTTTEKATFLGALWAGLSEGDDHSAGGWWEPAYNVRSSAGWAYYYRLTGDPDAREALREIADFMARDGHNVGHAVARQHGGAMTTLLWAYDELGDERYLEGVRETVADIRTHVDQRRGPYADWNANHNFWVSVPWFASELVDIHYRLWQLTGDVEYAATALGLAEAMMAENAVWGVPGEMGGYSGDPGFQMSSNYNMLIGAAIGYGYEMTGDPEFLLWARACCDVSVAKGTVDPITNTYWLTPALLYTLHQHREVETPRPSAPKVRVLPNREGA